MKWVRKMKMVLKNQKKLGQKAIMKVCLKPKEMSEKKK